MRLYDRALRHGGRARFCPEGTGIKQGCGLRYAITLPGGKLRRVPLESDELFEARIELVAGHFPAGRQVFAPTPDAAHELRNRFWIFHYGDLDLHCVDVPARVSPGAQGAIRIMPHLSLETYLFFLPMTKL